MAMRKRRPSPPPDRLNPHARRRSVERYVERAGARPRHYPGEAIPRGTVLYATVDLNLPDERGVRPDGSDRHEVKGRPVAVWATRPNGDVVAMPLSANLSDGMARRPADDKTATAEPVLGCRAAFIHRLVLVPVMTIHWGAPVDALGPDDLRQLERLVDSGVLADLTDRPRARPTARIGRRDPAAADEALAELRRRRQRIIAALEGNQPDAI